MVHYSINRKRYSMFLGATYFRSLMQSINYMVDKQNLKTKSNLMLSGKQSYIMKQIYVCSCTIGDTSPTK